MNLSSKLRRILPQQDNPENKRTQADALDDILHGRQVDTPYGSCYLIEKNMPLSQHHGYWMLQEAQKNNYANLEIFKVGIDQFDLQEAIFLDTETTGLAGGTGTYAFLIGLGSFESDNFVVKQLLMRDYHEEPALLYLLEQELQDKKTIISFNGKAFDVPLLQTRFTISRLDCKGVANHNQLDLLHLSRRFWKQKLENCRLVNLESQILGVHRVGDIPGYEIPVHYFEFLQTRDGRLLEQIVEHNATDVVSMATLLYRLQITADLKPAECDCPCEAEALARLALENKEPYLALQYLKSAEQLTEEEEQYLRILGYAASIYKRLKKYEDASVLWKRILQASPHDLAACEELAKYYEHRLRNLGSARQITRQALAFAWQCKSPKIPALEHRLKRIERKASALSVPTHKLQDL